MPQSQVCSWASSACQYPRQATEPLRPLHGGEKVHLLRGFTNVLSPGIDQLADELRKRNVSTTITNHAFAADLAREALQDCKSGRITSIVLVGHSFGASAALGIAETLKEAGIQVALIVTFDPVTRIPFPPMSIGWKISISRTGSENRCSKASIFADC